MERSRVSSPMKRVLAWATGRFILRSLRGHFRAVYLLERARPDPDRSTVVFANHHSWWDGYLAFLLQQHWRVPAGRVWMREWHWFPPFGTVGAMPFPDDDVKARMRTIRRTIRTLASEPSLLALFPERDLHPAPELLPFHRVLWWLPRQAPGVALLPVAIQAVPGIHQYDEVYIASGDFFACGESDERAWLEAARREIERLLEKLDETRRSNAGKFRCILEGRKSASERWRCSGRSPGDEGRSI